MQSPDRTTPSDVVRIAAGLPERNVDWKELGPVLLDALAGFEVVDCARCEGSGMDWDSTAYRRSHHEACIECGGGGIVTRGGWPNDVRVALEKARFSGALK